MNNLAITYWRQERYDKAEQLYLETLEIQKRVLGEDHRRTLGTMGNLAIVYHTQGRYDDAEPLYLKTLRINTRLLGKTHPGTLKAMSNLAVLYMDQGQYDEAESLLLQTLQIQEEILGVRNPSTLYSMVNLGELYYLQDLFEKAQPLQERAVNESRHVWPESSWFIGSFLGDHGRTLIKLQRYEEAEAALLEAHEILVAARGSDFENTTAVTEWLADLYDAWGKPRLAAEWRAKLPIEQEAVSADQPSPPDDKQGDDP
jgi:tetratricopeptide (TPR) repeat protein